MDLLDSFKAKKSGNGSRLSPENSGNDTNRVPRITKESLLSGLPDRVKNLKTDIKEEDKYEQNRSQQDVSMEPEEDIQPKEEGSSEQREDSDI